MPLPKTVTEPRGKSNRATLLRDLRAEDEERPPRPRVRGDCADGPRPCPWVGCAHHLYLDGKPGAPSFQLNFPALETNDGPDLDALPDTCSLDVADRGEQTLDAVGKALNVSRESARLIEAKALRKVERSTRAGTSGADLIGPWERLGETTLPPAGEEF